MKKLKILELFNNLKIKVSDDGKIYTLDHSYLRKNGTTFTYNNYTITVFERGSGNDV